MKEKKNKTPVPYSRHMKKYYRLLKLLRKSIFKSQNTHNAKYAAVSL